MLCWAYALAFNQSDSLLSPTHIKYSYYTCEILKASENTVKKRFKYELDGSIHDTPLKEAKAACPRQSAASLEHHKENSRLWKQTGHRGWAGCRLIYKYSL